MILNALVEQVKRRSKGDFKGRHRPRAAQVIGRKPWFGGLQGNRTQLDRPRDCFVSDPILGSFPHLYPRCGVAGRNMALWSAPRSGAGSGMRSNTWPGSVSWPWSAARLARPGGAALYGIGIGRDGVPYGRGWLPPLAGIAGARGRAAVPSCRGGGLRPGTPARENRDAIEAPQNPVAGQFPELLDWPNAASASISSAVSTAVAASGVMTPPARGTGLAASLAPIGFSHGPHVPAQHGGTLRVQFAHLCRGQLPQRYVVVE